jgi:signal transduction histidine kinase
MSWTEDLPVWTTPVLHLTSQLFFPAALLVAVLGQQLWGIRLAVSRAVAWSLLTAILVGAYVGIVSLLGALFPGVTDGFERVAATAAIAAAIGPVLRFVQRRVDHLVHGESREPIRAVDRVGRGVDVTGSPEDLLSGVLDELVSSLRLRGASIEVAGRNAPVTKQASSGDAHGPDELVTPLVLDDELIGSLTVWPRPGERLDATTRRALSALAPTIAIATRLTTTAVELVDSRARLSTARDAERSALRRELHDGLGPAIAGVGYGLRAARNLIATDPDAAATLLDTLAGEVEARVEDVRMLARELVPPALVESGLPAALAELAERYRLGGFEVDLDIGEAIPALPQPTASALYGIAVEGVRNASRHSGSTGCVVGIRLDSDALVLSVDDSGTGIADDASTGVGLQSMRERADAIGARLTISNPPAGGTSVTVRLDRVPT